VEGRNPVRRNDRRNVERRVRRGRNERIACADRLRGVAIDRTERPTYQVPPRDIEGRFGLIVDLELAARVEAVALDGGLERDAGEVGVGAAASDTDHVQSFDEAAVLQSTRLAIWIKCVPGQR